MRPRYRPVVVPAAIAAGLLSGPSAAQDADLIARGEQVAAIGGCANCHSRKDGAPFAGGSPIETAYGIFHAPNITPDPTEGIGSWEPEDFAVAMRQGTDPEGWPYYPAFPYTSYTHVTDEDLAALWAYLRSLEPVAEPSRPHELSFPYNQRWALYGWQWLFFVPERFVPDPARGEPWNRGAYLVTGLGHCGECHTPRTWYLAMDQGAAFTGAEIGEDERAPNITSDPEHGIGDWSTGDIVSLLQLGILPDGDFVGGDMAAIVRNGTSKLPRTDLDAIAEFLASIPPG